MVCESLGAIDNFGFPMGYFVIKSVATGRVLDVEGGKTDDAVELVLWPEKETSLVEDLRTPEADNQVFFIDDTGALCSRLSGHAIDVESNGTLIQRHRRPMSYPFPNSYSHPLPQFSYSERTGHITLTFASDPTFPSPSSPVPPSNAWKDQTFTLTSVPKRKARSYLDDASVFFSSLLGSGSTDATAATEHVHGTDINLRDDEILESDRLEADEADDSPERLRRVRMIGVKPNSNEGGSDAELRRQWRVFGISQSRAKASWIAAHKSRA